MYDTVRFGNETAALAFLIEQLDGALSRRFFWPCARM